MKLLPVFCMAVLLAGIAGGAQAQTLNFNLTGTILPGVCRFTVADVNLGTYTATQFTGSFATPFVDVPVTSAGCDPLVATVHMRVTGTPDVANASLFRGLAGVGVELQVKLPNAPVVPAGTTVTFPPVASGSVYMFQARFRQSAPNVAAGRVSSPITLTVTYN